ncbi:MAG: hypothetical protein WDO73_33255 [Ignavibacteriota bacterium]
MLRVVFRYTRGSFYFCFVTLAAFTFGWIATIYYLGGYDTIPESRRYAIEFELFLAMALVEAIRMGARHTNSTVRLCAIGTTLVLLLSSTPQLWAYVNEGWRPLETHTARRVRRVSSGALDGRSSSGGDASSRPAGCGSDSIRGSMSRRWAAVLRPACKIAFRGISRIASAPRATCNPDARHLTRC